MRNPAAQTRIHREDLMAMVECKRKIAVTLFRLGRELGGDEGYYASARSRIADAKRILRILSEGRGGLPRLP